MFFGVYIAVCILAHDIRKINRIKNIWKIVPLSLIHIWLMMYFESAITEKGSAITSNIHFQLITCANQYLCEVEGLELVTPLDIIVRSHEYNTRFSNSHHNKQKKSIRHFGVTCMLELVMMYNKYTINSDKEILRPVKSNKQKFALCIFRDFLLASGVNSIVTFF